MKNSRTFLWGFLTVEFSHDDSLCSRLEGSLHVSLHGVSYNNELDGAYHALSLPILPTTQNVWLCQVQLKQAQEYITWLVLNIFLGISHGDLNVN